MKLSPCKHCGSPAHLVKNVTDPHLCWSVQCSNLDCGISTRAFSQQDVAVGVWQRVAKRDDSRFNITPEQDKDIAAIVQFRFDMNGRLDNIDWSECMWEIFDTVLTSEDKLALQSELRTTVAYSHRNGETEAPTMPGRYWFKGRCHARDLADLTPVMVTDDPEILAYSVEILAWLPGWDGGQFEDIKWFSGQWWGPVVTPWEPAE